MTQVLIISTQMKNPSEILPLKFGNQFEAKSISWEDFKGQIDQSMPWSAHIYWHMEYKIIDQDKKKMSISLSIGHKSWVKEEKKSDHLLNHEQGHFLIGALCALDILKRVDYKKKISSERFEDIVLTTFDRTIKEYLQLEKQYDNETQHRLNFKKQEQWDNFLYERLTYYKQIYDSKNHKFVKYSQSPTKKK